MHQSADVERLLAVGIVPVGEDVTDDGKVAVFPSRVWCAAYVAVDRVDGHGPARVTLARDDVRVLVMGEQDRAGVLDRLCPVLALSVRAHDTVEASDAEVVLGRHTAGKVQCLLAGEHHRAVGCHHEDAACVQQHGGLGVPVRLGAHVHSRDDDVHLAAALREFDETAEDGGDPVHVLGAAVHRDARTGREREPLDRHPQPLGEVDAGDDATALRLGEVAQPARGITQQHDPGHSLRHLGGVVGEQANHDVGHVLPGQPVDGYELAGSVEVVLGETARWESARARPAVVRAFG